MAEAGREVPLSGKLAGAAEAAVKRRVQVFTSQPQCLHASPLHAVRTPLASSPRPQADMSDLEGRVIAHDHAVRDRDAGL